MTDIESRVHVASAYQAAACLYILQALPLARAVRPVDTDLLVSDILGHLAHIEERDPYFKAIEMLKATWAMQDGCSGVNWLQGLRDMGFDYLIV